MALCRAWAEEVVKNKDWAEEMGIPVRSMGNISEFSHLPGYSAMMVYMTTGFGQVWFKTLDDHVKKRGIQVLFDSPGKELIQDPLSKAIIGIEAESGGKKVYIRVPF